MAAKGTQSKETILKALQTIFKGAFVHDKILRIPVIENGEPVEIKVTLTAAKDLVGTISAFSSSVNSSTTFFSTVVTD